MAYFLIQGKAPPGFVRHQPGVPKFAFELGDKSAYVLFDVAEMLLYYKMHCPNWQKFEKVVAHNFGGRKSLSKYDEADVRFLCADCRCIHGS